MPDRRGWESRIRNSVLVLMSIPSSTEPVKLCVNLSGPPDKPKYFLMTDSAEYREGMVKSTPGGE